MQQAFILKLCKQTLLQRVSTRYGQQAELKEQNQHLVATNEELKKNLTDAQVHKRQKIPKMLCNMLCVRFRIFFF